MFFPIVRLGDIAIVKGGKRLPKGEELTTENTGHPYIRARDIGNGKVTFNDPVFVPDNILPTIKNYTVKQDDICITIVGANVGDVGQVPSFLNGANLTENAVKLIAIKEKCDQQYLKYALLTEHPQAEMKTVAGGAAQPKLGIYKIIELEIPLPPLEIQHRIAAILSAYDDLIENNAQRIKALEQAAHDLYREWFVEFRFPGHDSVEMVDSGTEYGEIPQGWEVVPLGDVVAFNIGGGWGQEQPKEKYQLPAYVIRGTDIPDARYIQVSKCPLRFHTESNLKSRRLKSGDIVFEVSGGSKGQPVGRALLITQQIINHFDEDLICASFCKLIRPASDRLTPELLYLYLQEIYNNGVIEKYQVQSTGIINFKFAVFLEDALIVAPNKTAQSKFQDFVKPIFNEIQTLGLKNNALREARDLLLPRLVSGQLDVSNVEIPH